MSQPTPYDPTHDFSVDIVPGDLGNALDEEFDDIQLTTDEILANLALIQRDDGALSNGIVTPFSLSTDTVALLSDWRVRGAWLTATAYTPLDFVTQSGIGYLCLVAHVSGTFATDLAAGKWTALSKVDSAASAFTLTLLDEINSNNWLFALGFNAYTVQFVQNSFSDADVMDALGFSAFFQTVVDDADGPAVCTTIGAVSKTLIDAKGDIITATAADTPVRKAAGADGSALVTDSAQSDGLIWVPQYPKSVAPNPFFQIDQRVNSATSRANDTYGVDRWYVLTQSNPVTVTAQVLQENGQASNVRVTQSNAAAQRFGKATIIHSQDCLHLRGQTVTFRPRVRISSSQAVRIAVLEWSGSQDNVASDVVNSWTNGSFTAGQFFKSTTQAVSGVGAKTPAANTWTDMDALTVTLGSSFLNLILFVWVEQTASQNVTLDIGKVRFVPGSYAGDIEIPNFADELARCQRFYEKSFGLGTQPQSGSGSTISATLVRQVPGAATNTSFFVPYRVRKFTPGGPVTFYNPISANAQIRNTTVNADCSGTTAVGEIYETGFVVSFATAAGSAANNANYFHWEAAHEL